MSATVLITGNTFPHKDALRAMGGKWDAKATGWKVPAAKAAEARALVNGGSGYQINGTGETCATVVSPDGATVAIIAPPPKPMKARMSEEERERRIVERNYRRSGDYYGSGKFDLDENP
jgi:hypothetical protein